MPGLRHQYRGFTLIELMIAVAVVALLAAVALPSYNEYVMRSHRANARAALLQAAQWMERTATAQGTYPLAAAIPPGVLFVEGGRYNINAASNNGNAYALTAIPTAPQVRDRCASFQINQAGTRLQVPTVEVPVPLGPLECWNR
ncbi:type IV pilin protein [Hydrogenophaga sp.]|uniref:type IV pilin protein n=1 Tax=Hydrogenophaga sp. TaxID=1904254 RepID=UPI00272F0C8C|nr:type IV pilin protein [Hydrogenophaga sp.]MDP2016252.1 type IV pilin protein [Hydrogenophaga sp.]MDP3164249.1 type IV pilin protein [Hydrogenophaga sp.]MDP3811110.1 type IV pilin protein [Hydrogenophaga sp.]